MPFTPTLPVFNCLFNSWRFDPVTFVWSRNLTEAPCQWYVNPKVLAISFPDVGDEEIILHFLRCPKGTDILEGDIVEVQSGEFIFYELIENERVHLNFPNEYAVGFANVLDFESTPFPLMDEDGLFILTESGDVILTEAY